MSQTEKVRPESFFGEFIIPLWRANMRRNVRYLNLGRNAETYWRKPVSRTGGLERLQPDGLYGREILERLGSHWTAQADVNLPKLVPYLIALHEQITAPAATETPEEPPVSDFVYPLF